MILLIIMVFRTGRICYDYHRAGSRKECLLQFLRTVLPVSSATNEYIPGSTRQPAHFSIEEDTVS